MRYRLKNVLIAVTVATLVTVPSVYADNAYRRAVPRGWLWYEETPAQPKPVPRRPPAPQPAAPVRAAQPESTGPELFSAAWVRQQLPFQRFQFGNIFCFRLPRHVCQTVLSEQPVLFAGKRFHLFVAECAFAFHNV